MTIFYEHEYIALIYWLWFNLHIYIHLSQSSNLSCRTACCLGEWWSRSINSYPGGQREATISRFILRYMYTLCNIDSGFDSTHIACLHNTSLIPKTMYFWLMKMAWFGDVRHPVRRNTTLLHGVYITRSRKNDVLSTFGYIEQLSTYAFKIVWWWEQTISEFPQWKPDKS